MPHRTLGLLMATIPLGFPVSGMAACHIQIVADLPVTIVQQKPVAPAKINGHDVLMIVDSGATSSGFPTGSAAQLDIPSAPPRGGLEVRSAGSAVAVTVGSVKDFELAGSTFHDVQVIVGGGIANVGAAGRLGENILGGEDTEYDLADGAVRLLRPQDCAAPKLTYWAADQAPASIAIEPVASVRQIRGVVIVNGTPVRAMFDTGSPYTFLDRAVATRAGVDVVSSKVRTGPSMRGVAGGPGIPVLLTDIQDLAVGENHSAHADVQVADFHSQNWQMLVGLDYFLTHRMVVDVAHNRLYVTDSGSSKPRLTSR